MASKFFSITAGDPGVLTGGRGEATLTVTNVSGRPIRGQLWLTALGRTQKDWLTVAGEPEKDFGVDETHSFTVRIQVPAGTGQGTYTFRPVVASFQRPNEDFDEGQMVAFQVSETAQRPPFKWWPLAVLAAVILAGTALYFVLRPSLLEVPDVVGKPAKEAMDLILSAGLQSSEAGRELTPSGDKLPPGVSAFPPPAGTVLRMKPRAGSKVKKETNVQLTLEAEAVLVPRLIGRTLEQAFLELRRRNLYLGKLGAVHTKNLQSVKLVAEQVPKENTRVLRNTEVDLKLFEISSSGKPGKNEIPSFFEHSEIVQALKENQDLIKDKSLMKIIQKK